MLRGEESDRDEAFVKQLADHYKVPFYSEKFDTTSYAAAHKYSIQEAARQLRYGWFESLIRESDLPKGNRKLRLLTAHPVSYTHLTLPTIYSV